MAGVMAASLQLCSVAQCFLLSTPLSPSSSLCSPLSYIQLCAHHAWQSQSPCLTQRVPATLWTPAVARVAVSTMAAAADDDKDGLFLYEEKLGLEEEHEAEANEEGQSVASIGANLMKNTFWEIREWATSSCSYILKEFFEITLG